MGDIERLYWMDVFGMSSETPKESGGLKEEAEESKREIKKEKDQKHKALLDGFGLDSKYFSIPDKCVCGNKLENIEMKKDIISGHEVVFIVLRCKCGRLNYPTKKI